jgi:hypothetical protein
MTRNAAASSGLGAAARSPSRCGFPYPRGDRLAKRSPGDFIDCRDLGLAASKLADRADTQTAAVRVRYDYLEQSPDSVDCASRAAQGGQLIMNPIENVAAQRGEVELPFVTESVIKTLPADAHCLNQCVGRGALKAMFCEHRYRGANRLVLSKAFGRGIGKC